MGTPSKRDTDAVAALVESAAASVILERMRGRLAELTGNDFPVVASLLDMLAESPRAIEDEILVSSVLAIKEVYVRLWNDCEMTFSSCSSQ